MSLVEAGQRSYRKIFRRGESLILHRPYLADALGFCAFLIAYYFAYVYAMSFSAASASPFWFPDSVLLCALLKTRPGRWWLFILASLPIRLFSDVAQEMPLWFLLATFAIDSTKGLVAALLLRRFMRNPLRFETVPDLAIFGLVAVLLVPIASAFAGAAARAALGYDYWSAWVQWFMGDALAQLVVTPIILYWGFGPPRGAKPPDVRRSVEAGLLVAGLILTGYLASHTEAGSAYFTEARFYAPVPFLFWAGVRFGVFGASGAIGLIALFAVEGALQGHGPYAGRTPDETAFLLQNFLLLRSAPLLLVAASLEQGKAIDRSLQESEKRFRAMADSAPILIWTSDRDALCDFFNQGWLAFTGRSLDQEIGNGWAEGVYPDDLQHCLEIYRSAFDARQPFRMEYRLRRHDGEYRWVLDAGAPRFAPDGEFMGYAGSAIEMTEQKEAQERALRLAHLQRLAVMGQLTAATAHELTQPLAAIMMNLEAARGLLDEANPRLDRLREIISYARADDEHASRVVSSIRALAFKVEEQMEPLDLNSIVADTLALVAGDARNRGVDIRAELNPELPQLFGNRTSLQQVLLNFVMNGMDAMADAPRSSRRLTVQTGLKDRDQVEVAVTDSGCGIAPDDLPRIFDSLFTTKRDGMGLGLFLARSIVLSHHGSIWAGNNPSGGATFHFTLPTPQSPLTAGSDALAKLARESRAP